jgi:hypothetical protein
VSAQVPLFSSIDAMLEFFRFIVARKKYFLIPIMLASFLVGGLLLLGANPTVSPFIYALF